MSASSFRMSCVTVAFVLAGCGSDPDTPDESTPTNAEIEDAAALVDQADNTLQTALDTANVRIEDAWVRTPIAGRNVTAGYARIQASAPLTLIRASSPDAERIELHSVEMDETNVMRMRRQDEFVMDNGGLVFEPGGAHLMIFGLNPDAVERGTLEITFEFESGPDRIITFEVRAL